MEEQGIIQDGHIVDDLVTLKTVLSKPKLCSISEVESRICIRKHLEEQGWEKAKDSARECSFESKRFNADAPLEYFLLLKHHLDDLCAYDDAYSFRRTQSKGYYEALTASIQNKDCSVFSVPVATFSSLTTVVAGSPSSALPPRLCSDWPKAWLLQGLNQVL